MSEPQSISRPLLLHVFYRAFLFAGLVVLLLMNTASVHAQEAQRTVVSRTKPEYPALALRMHISGSVLVIASVKPDGTVTNVRATTGHAFLQGPAEQAVRQWKFSRSTATTDTTVEVRFNPDFHS